jgi:hypothetical protein
MRLILRVSHQGMDGERVYESEADLAEKTTLETIEAHARTMLALLANQASRDCEEDEDDDGENWEKAKA